MERLPQAQSLEVINLSNQAQNIIEATVKIVIQHIVDIIMETEAWPA